MEMVHERLPTGLIIAATRWGWGERLQYPVGFLVHHSTAANGKWQVANDKKPSHSDIGRFCGPATENMATPVRSSHNVGPEEKLVGSGAGESQTELVDQAVHGY